MRDILPQSELSTLPDGALVWVHVPAGKRVALWRVAVRRTHTRLQVLYNRDGWVVHADRSDGNHVSPDGAWHGIKAYIEIVPAHLHDAYAMCEIHGLDPQRIDPWNTN